jgi:hypothetical protein
LGCVQMGNWGFCIVAHGVFRFGCVLLLLHRLAWAALPRATADGAATVTCPPSTPPPPPTLPTTTTTTTTATTITTTPTTSTSTAAVAPSLPVATHSAAHLPAYRHGPSRRQTCSVETCDAGVPDAPPCPPHLARRSLAFASYLCSFTMNGRYSGHTRLRKIARRSGDCWWATKFVRVDPNAKSTVVEAALPGATPTSPSPACKACRGQACLAAVVSHLARRPGASDTYLPTPPTPVMSIFSTCFPSCYLDAMA